MSSVAKSPRNGHATTAVRIKPRAPEPILIEVDRPGFYHVTPDGNAAFVHRDEAPPVLAGPQPVPIAVHGNGVFSPPLILRFWENLEVTRHCRFCPTCAAFTHPETGEAMCLVMAPEGITNGECAAFAFREQGVDGKALESEDAAQQIWSCGIDNAKDYRIGPDADPAATMH